MATTTSHNKKSSAVKRILSEARELEADGSDEYVAAPLENNIFEWHFTLRGPLGTEFERGLYHGRILLPPEYPMRPPNLMLLTPNGRWECNKKICLTFTGFHEEMWQPAWGVRTALLGVQAFMSAKAEAATGVGSLDYPEEERRKLAERSRQWRCVTCGNCTGLEMLPDPDPSKAKSDQGRTKESLPEGLTVDEGAEKRKQAETVQQDATEAAVGAPVEASTTAAAQLEVAAEVAAITDSNADGSMPARSGSSTSAAAPVQSELSTASSSRTTAENNRAQLPTPEAAPLPTLSPPSNGQQQSRSTSTLASSGDNSSSVARNRSAPSSAERYPPRPTSRTAPIDHERDDDRPHLPHGHQPQQHQHQQQPQAIPAAVLAAAGIPPRPPTRSEARVAQLDRAILTVVLLLCGLVVRRLL